MRIVREVGADIVEPDRAGGAARDPANLTAVRSCCPARKPASATRRRSSPSSKLPSPTPEKYWRSGAATGQHAVYFARHLSHLVWLPSDKPGAIHWIRERLELEGPDNVEPPIEIDVVDRPWDAQVDGLFSANTLHIMSLAGGGGVFRRASAKSSTSGAPYVFMVHSAMMVPTPVRAMPASTNR